MGLEINYAWYVANLQLTGSFHFPARELPTDLAEFRRDLRRAAKAAGIRVHTSDRGHTFFAWDPDYEVSPEQLRAVVEAAALGAPDLPPWCPSCGGPTMPQGKSWRCEKCDVMVLAPQR
ncbi:hypothetical protein [Agromyces bauzanensis]|uniref:Uncharacterized protein n=1 Tax=Agromyces bauzanensis TaxID=1308924 RepID=A0A917PUM8_9MICO|nr:hypothetical protein [Agromyces bauzanensis]GGJ92639.1 hypothetical protein GCM10011372_33940 [Agromyces bauzanensis]